MEALDIREFLNYEDLVKLQLLVSCKINRLEHENYHYVLERLYGTYADNKAEIRKLEELYHDLELIMKVY